MTRQLLHRVCGQARHEEDRYVAARSHWGLSPRDSIETECARRGSGAVIAGCRALLRGEGVDPGLLHALGGPAAQWAVTGEQPGPAYWTRVWAARGLLWAWDDQAYPEVLAALNDDAWRVREMAIKVVARHRLGGAASTVVALRADSNPRVAQRATRALTILTAETA